MSAGKYLQALRALNTVRSLDAGNPELHVRIADFKTRGVSIFPYSLSKRTSFTGSLATTVLVDSSSPPSSADIAPIISSGLDELAPGQPTLEQLNASFLQQGPTTAGKLFAAAQVAVLAKLPNAQSQAEEYIFQMLNDEARPTVPVSARSPSSPILH